MAVTSSPLTNEPVDHIAVVAHPLPVIQADAPDDNVIIESKRLLAWLIVRLSATSEWRDHAAAR